ncbi:hypothetical protein AB0F49_07405 [Micromonospora ureilytica]|uniref:hypothetical protein n=1 Tax=Micromonospora ureilytica TaxID=709868 RepID=UPI00340ED527
MPLTVTLRELTNSYVRLREAADSTPVAVCHLLRFYSVECGLKSIVLRERSARDTTQQPDIITHDLRELAKALKLSAAAYQNLTACQRRSRGGFSHPPVQVPQLHEAWRYGAELDPEEEKRVVAGLTVLGQLCVERIGR